MSSKTNSNCPNPFPGLRPFRQDEDYLFFGREEQTMELLQRLGANRFVAVVGTSGSGKSSLVRCGLLSELLGGKLLRAGASWEVAVTQPGGNPLALLADAILDADLYDRDQDHVREQLLATLSRSQFGLVEAVKQARLPEGTNFLLVVDQFEEIFRFNEAGQAQQEVANEFVSLLLEAVEQTEVPIYVVLTMRSDFIGDCGQFEGLAEMVNRGEFLIPRLSRDQYKRVIEAPIKVAGGQITPRLLQRLLNDLGQQADQLPCLQHALMRTWSVWSERGETEALDLDDYQRVGRMSEALSLHADEIFDSLESDRQRELCAGMFKALTVQESENRGIRRPQRLGSLCQILEVSADELRPIIEAFRRQSVTFLMPPAGIELTDKTIIDISHESLMRVWARLRRWVDEEAQAVGIYRRLSESAVLHDAKKAGLYRDPELGIALAWRETSRPNQAWAERYHPGFLHALEFLDASQEAHLAEEREHAAAQQRELEHAHTLASAERARAETETRSASRLRIMLAGTAIVAVIAVGASLVAFKFWRDADDAKQAAVLAKQEAERSEASAKQSATTAQTEANRATLKEAEAKAARREAEENLARARGAIDDYMTKVSESQLLSTPGLQPLRAELLASASQFYEDILKKDPNNPDLQAGLAAAFYRVGFVRWDTGELVQSQQALERAAQFYTSALKTQPANSELKHGLANSWFMLAVIKMLSREGTSSNEYAKQAAQIWEELIQGGGKDLRFHKELARAYNIIGINFSNELRQEEAFLAYQRSLSIRLSLISEHPDDVQLIHGLAESFSNIANLVTDPKLRLQMELRGIVYAERAHQLRPQNVEYATDLSGFYTSTAAVLATQDRSTEADDLLRRNLNHLARFIRGNPSVPAMRQLFPSSIARLSILPSGNADPETRMALIRDCAQMSAALPKETPEDYYVDAQTQAMCLTFLRLPVPAAAPPRVQRPADDGKPGGGDPALAELSRGELGLKMTAELQQGFQLMQQNQSAEGYRRFQESAKYARELQRRFPNLSPQEQAAMGGVFYNNACALALGGNPSAALSSLREAVNVGFADTDQLDSDSDLATVRSLPEFKTWRKEMDAAAATSANGRPPTAVSKDSNDLREQGIKALELAIAAGFKDVQRLEQDPTLAPLRQHSQFPKLVALLKQAGGTVAVTGGAPTGERTASGAELAQFNQDRAIGHQVFGVIETSLNRTEQAGKSLDQALALRQTLAAAAPEDKQIQAELASMRSALAPLYWNTGRLVKARELFLQQIKDLEQQVQEELGGPAANPAEKTQSTALRDLAAAERAFADALAGSGLWDEAMPRYVQALKWSSKLKTTPTEQEYRDILAPMLWLLESTDQSYPAVCEQALVKYPPSSDSELVARAARLCALSPKAVPDLAPVLSLTEKAQGGWHGYTLGLVLYRLGRFDDAIRKIDDARQKRQLVGVGVEEFVLAMAHFQAGRKEKAKTILAAVNQKSPRSMAAWTHSPHNMLDVDWLVLRKEANQLIYGSPYGVEDRRRRGNTYTQLGEFDKAEAELASAIESLPDDPRSLFPRARLQWELGHKEQAAETLEQARQALTLKWAESAGDVEFWRTCAETYRLLGRPNDATEALRRAIAAQTLAVIKSSRTNSQRWLLRQLNDELIKSLRTTGQEMAATAARQELETLYAAFSLPPIVDSAADLLTDSGQRNVAPSLTLAAIDRLISTRGNPAADKDPVQWQLLGRLHHRRAEVLQASGGTAKEIQDATSAAGVQYERLLAADPQNADAADGLADLLLMHDSWKILQPTEMNSQGGEKLTRETDGSIFVTGPDPERALYTLKFRTDLPAVASIRLETLLDPRLPQGGSGRFPGNGNFHLGELTAAIESGHGDGKPTPIEISSATADDQGSTQVGASKIVDGNPQTYWDTHPRHMRPHWVVFGLKSPAKINGGTLIITLDSGIDRWGKHGLGRFRISASDLPDAYQREQQRLAARRLTDPWAKLSAAYILAGNAEGVADLLAKSEDKNAGLASVLETGVLIDRVLESLQARHPDVYASLLPDAANVAAERGQIDQARTLYERLARLQPENVFCKERLAQLQPGVVGLWNFDAGLGSWGNAWNCEIGVKEGVLTARTTGSDPQFSTMASGPAGNKALVLRYRTDEAFTMQLFWLDSAGYFDDARHVDYPVPASPGEWGEIMLPFSNQQSLRSLRLDPNTKGEHPLEIDSVVLRQLSPIEYTRLLAEFGVKPELARLTREIEASPMSAAKYHARANFLTQAGRWREAAEDYSQEVKLTPDDRLSWFRLANSLLLAGDEEAYRRHCRAMVAQFKDTSDANIADSVCKTCLLRPGAMDLAELPIQKLREATADPKNEEFRNWFVACCALISFREGNHEEAIAWTKKSSSLEGQTGALALVVRAMAEQQLGQADTARNTLAQAETLIPADLRTLGTDNYSGPLPVAPSVVAHDWLTPEILRREAAKLLADGKPAEKKR